MLTSIFEEDMNKQKDRVQNRGRSIQREVAGVSNFVLKNILTIMMFGLLGLLGGAAISLTTNSYSPGLLFHTYEIKMVSEGNINSLENSLGDKKKITPLSSEFARFLRSKLPGVFLQKFTSDSQIQLQKVVVEELPPLTVRISSKNPLEAEELKRKLYESFFFLSNDWSTRGKVKFAEVKAKYQAFIDKLYPIYQKQSDLVREVMQHVSPEDLRSYNVIFSSDAKKMEGDPFIDLRQFSFLIHASNLDSKSKIDLFHEFVNILPGTRKSSTELENLSAALESTSKTGTEAFFVEGLTYEVADISNKMLGTRAIICLSGLLGGVLVGLTAVTLKGSVFNFVSTLWKNESFTN